MKKRGRPKLDISKNEVVQLRVYPEVKRLFEAAARDAGQSLTAWATQRLQDAVGREMKNNRREGENSS